MHCPRCGQQQSSSITKFCSRCGFQLGIVAELLAHDGTLPQLAELYNKRSGIFTRKNGVAFSSIWFIIFVLMFPAIFAILGGDEIVGLVAAFGVFSTLILFIASLAFLRSGSAKMKHIDLVNSLHAPAHEHLAGANTQTALPGESTRPANSYIAPQGKWRASDTGEFAVPDSVTDGTTKLLKNDE